MVSRHPKGKTQRTCPECVHDGGYHYSDDLVPVAYRCPNYVAADAAEAGMKAAAEITDTQVIGAAFNALARSKDAPIESTGRRVPSKLDSTNGHGILVWRSLVCRSAVAS